MGMNGNRKPLILKGLNGGRAGTRTPDLLRVNKAGVLHGFHGFLVFAWLYTNSAHLLFRSTQLVSIQRVGFWNTFGPLALAGAPRRLHQHRVPVGGARSP